jgi:hypothetical protein
MVKMAIIAGSLALGGAGVAFVGYLDHHPLAFTHPASRTSTTVVRNVADVPVATDFEDHAMLLPEVTVKASLPRRQATVPAKMMPCSDWSKVGAKYIDKSGATGERSVRNLCVR